jgi:hypothetical protein
MSDEPMGPIEPRDPLEERLRALQPAELPPGLMRELRGVEPVRSQWFRWVWAAPLAAAATWLILGQLTHHGPPPSAPASLLARAGTPRSTVLPSDFRVFVPVSESSHLLGISDLGVVDTSPTQAVRLLRTTWIDDTTFRGDDGRSTIRRAKPRETIIPVALDVF